MTNLTSARKRTTPSSRTNRKGPYVELVTVTPKMATEWLKEDATDRHINVRHIEMLMRSIERGEWVVTGDTIKFSPDGRRMDGRHRLEAIRRAGKSVKLWIARNVEPQAIHVIDTGRKRTMSNQLAIQKEPNANMVAAALVWLWAYREDALLLRPAPSHLELFEVLRIHPGIRNAVSCMSRNRPPTGISQMATLAYCGSLIDADATESFIDDVAQGASMKRTNPAFLLRERMLAHKTTKRKMGRVEIFALAIKAFNAYRRGDELRFLRWARYGNSAEEFPGIQGFDRAVLFIQQDVTVIT